MTGTCDRSLRFADNADARIFRLLLVNHLLTTEFSGCEKKLCMCFDEFDEMSFFFVCVINMSVPLRSCQDPSRSAEIRSNAIESDLENTLEIRIVERDTRITVEHVLYPQAIASVFRLKHNEGVSPTRATDDI